MALLLHVSDPHFGTELPPLVAALQRLARTLAPDVVVVSGDITQRARRAQFDAAARFLRSLGGRAQIVVPGNHDIPLYNLLARAGWPYAGYCRAFGSMLEPRYTGTAIAVAGVNTTRPWRHKHGEVSPAQVHAVARWLRGVPRDCVRVVVTHHPLAATLPSDRNNVLRGAADAATKWAAAGADIVLAGHIHWPFVVPLHERLPAVKRPLWAVNAGTAVSRRVRAGAPPSVNVLRAGGGAEAVVERWDYDAAEQAFCAVARQPLALSR